MINDDKYVYVFIRQDLPIPLQLVHVAHASYHAARVFRPDEGLPSVVMIGIPHAQSLARVMRKLKDEQVPHFVWDDPDDSDGALAVCTAPLAAKEKKALSNYRLYTRVAQSLEHSTFSREVAVGETLLGGNPAPGASS